MIIDREELLERLVAIQYERNDLAFERGTFRVRGDCVEVYPPSSGDKAVRIELFGDEIDSIKLVDVVTARAVATLKHYMLFPNTHYIAGPETMERAVRQIMRDKAEQVRLFNAQNKLLEAQRIDQRTNYDVEMIKEIGYCSGIENYSRYLDGREPGEPPFTLLDYFPDDFLLVVDESHATLPQLRAMYAGDRSRKERLVEYGFRLPSALDNRPLSFEEFETKYNQMICISATPAQYELDRAGLVAEQIVRPTGLLDPEIIIRPVNNQIDDLLENIRLETQKGFRVLVTTLTKKMAEMLTDFLAQQGIRVRYLHSEVHTFCQNGGNFYGKLYP